MINFLHQPDVLNVSFERAGKLLSLYWLGAMIGRFLGSAALLRVPAARLLTVFTLIAALLCFTVTQFGGGFAAYSAIAVGLFNSIMFPVIFTLTLERSTASQAATSGLLCMAIVGGALLPPLTGQVADRFGLHSAFVVPAVAYAGLFVFALAATRARLTAASEAATGMAH
jgi:FHS family L-fucose permease-like MFS transporter